MEWRLDTMPDMIFSILFLVVLPIVILVWFGVVGGVRLHRITRTPKGGGDSLWAWSNLIVFRKSQEFWGYHPQEQYLIVLKGSLECTIGTHVQELAAREAIYIEGEVYHGVKALEDTMIASIWISPGGLGIDTAKAEFSHAIQLPLATPPTT